MGIVYESWGGLSPKDDAQWTSWWDEYVPAEGKCDSVGGEIMRAMSRIVYRYYNDGDTVDEYGGSEYNLCKGAMFFLLDNVPGFKPLCGYQGDMYEEQICDRLKFVFDYLNNHQELFSTPNNEDYLDLSPFEPWVDEDEDYYDLSEEY